MKRIKQDEYFSSFGAIGSGSSGNLSPADAAKTFEVILATRQFEIQMYWTRTAYFWTLIGAAFAGYFALQASEASPADKQFLGFTISVIGAVLSLGWGLANKGSKYWHENWENHAQLLEDAVVGPIFKTLLERTPPNSFPKRFSQIVSGPSKFSVSKINLLFSWFFSCLWFGLGFISLPPIVKAGDVNYKYMIVGSVASIFVILLFTVARTWDKNQSHYARLRTTEIIDP